ncbi:hypothetical protein [Nocardia sp. NPDC058480]|uniref:hypothetical protein n=2 Tax=unclassified Nocardia TaxID=2637762 RepID=UPI00364C2D91
MSIRKFVMAGMAIAALGAMAPATAMAAPTAAAPVAETGSADATSGSGVLVMLIEEFFKPCPFSSTVCPTTDN